MIINITHSDLTSLGITLNAISSTVIAPGASLSIARNTRRVGDAIMALEKKRIELITPHLDRRKSVGLDATRLDKEDPGHAEFSKGLIELMNESVVLDLYQVTVSDLPPNLTPEIFLALSPIIADFSA